MAIDSDYFKENLNTAKDFLKWLLRLDLKLFENEQLIYTIIKIQETIYTKLQSELNQVQRSGITILYMQYRKKISRKYGIPNKMAIKQSCQCNLKLYFTSKRRA